MAGKSAPDRRNAAPRSLVALEQALACYRAPGLLVEAVSRPLPADVGVLLRIAAGDEPLAYSCAQASGESIERVTEAATFYIQQTQFLADADSYRVLGVAHDAADAQIREHYRLLVRWLHPDRNHDGWESSYADLVNRAWRDLRTPERRQAYDAELAEAAVPPPVYKRDRPGTRVLILNDDAVIPDRRGNRLPAFVVASLAVVAATALVLMWFVRTPGVQRPRPERLDPDAMAAVVLPVPESVGAVADPDDVPGPGGDAEAAGASGVPSPTPNASLAAESQPLPEPIPEPIPALTAQRASAAHRNGPDAPSADRGPAIAGARSVATTMPAPVQEAAAPFVAPVRQPPARTAPRPATEVAAAPTPVAPVPAQARTDAAVDEAESRQLLREFEVAYVAGDIDRLMAMFTADARNNRGARDAIAADYGELFATSQRRRLDLEPEAWFLRDGIATVVARYHASVRRSGQWLTERSDGSIRFELRREGGTVKIQRVVHAND